MKTSIKIGLSLGMLLLLATAAAGQAVNSDSWAATDALGRKVREYKNAGDKKKDKFVGIFYLTWHMGRNDTTSQVKNITEIVRQHPEAMKDYNHPAWGTSKPGIFFWDEPLFGYYKTTDPWVLRKHAEMLADAGIDVVFCDCTNGTLTYSDSYEALMKTWDQAQKDGVKVPKIAFLLPFGAVPNSLVSLRQLYNDVYKPGRSENLWFRWKGKPLLMFGQHIIGGRQQMDDVRFPKEIRDFFTIRQSWAWTTLRWYDDGHDEWPWVDHYPQSVGWHESPDRAEYVASAQHPLSNIGRSFRDGVEPEHDRYDATTDTDKGLYFDQQWQRALEVDPEFIFVTGWNEWTAGQMNRTNPDYAEEMKKWDFFPGAKCGTGGREVKMGEGYFIDQYNQEFSRDIEPMKGGHTDNYYYQLIANVRKYKGVAKPEPAGEPVTIDLNGGFDQWRQVKKTYYDHAGDTYHRDSPGNFAAGPYVNATGRNDIIESKVARDDKYVYFYVKTAQPLTPHTDPYWMLLFIDTDRQHATGWEGYDLLVNDGFRSGKSMVKTYDKTGWRKSREAAYRYQGNELMVSVPRSCFGPGKLAFDFHWADGIQKLGDIDEFLLNGDQAPSRRANYRYEED